jgi:hypothetical protein
MLNSSSNLSFTDSSDDESIAIIDVEECKLNNEQIICLKITNGAQITSLTKMIFEDINLTGGNDR